MPYEYTITKGDGYLLYVTRGELDNLEELIACTSEALKQAIAKDCDLLIDDRKLTIDLSYLDAILTGEYMSNRDLQTKGVRIATVQTQANMELGHMFETALTNRSLVFKVFEDRESAIIWLQSG